MRPTRVVFLFVLLAGLIGPAGAAPPGFASAGGPCFQGALALTAPSANVRRYVPADFPLVEAAGRAAIFAYTVRCEDFTVDDGPAQDVTLTGVAAFVLPPDGSLGVQVYDMLMTTDGLDFYQAVTELGLAQGFVEVGFTTRSVAGPVVQITADTPWVHSPYGWTLLAIKPPNVGVPFPSTHWQDGSRGRVRIDYAHSSLIITPGVGTLTAKAGSPLAHLLGTTSVTTPGAILQFSSFTAQTRLQAGS